MHIPFAFIDFIPWSIDIYGHEESLYKDLYLYSFEPSERLLSLTIAINVTPQEEGVRIRQVRWR
jgi:hypothetical protein